MANTKSAKKATRVAARRTEVNKNRVSRIRTYVRKVEEAIASGNQARSPGCPAGRPARTHARRPEGRHAQEHGIAQGFAPERARKGSESLIIFFSRIPKLSRAGAVPAGAFCLSTVSTFVSGTYCLAQKS